MIACHVARSTVATSAVQIFIFSTIPNTLIAEILIVSCARNLQTVPRPGHSAIIDQGNAGNLMFGPNPGLLYSIDPEMKVTMSSVQEEAYARAVESAIEEIVHSIASEPRYEALEALFFKPHPGFVGILDLSLEDFSPWHKANETQKQAIDSILQMIRIRANAENRYIINASGREPPESNEEDKWREWMRWAAPRAVADVLAFVAGHTAYPTPPLAASYFRVGVLQSLQAALQFKADLSSKKMVFHGLLSNKEKHSDFVHVMARVGDHVDVQFILRLIGHLAKFEADLPASEASAKRQSGAGVVGASVKIGTMRWLNKARKSIHEVATTQLASVEGANAASAGGGDGNGAQDHESTEGRV